MSGEKVEIKKVRPYPIEVLVTSAGEAQGFRSQIIKVNTTGIFIEDQKMFTPGTKMKVQFELPVLKHFVNQDVVVRKMIDRYDPSHQGEGPKVKRFVECHFVALSYEDKQKIFQFTSKIGQKD